MKTSDKPIAIVANTVKGKGVSFMENRLEWHYKSPNDEHLEKFAKALGVDIRDLFTFSHLNGKYIPEINKLLLDADESQLKMVYKVVLAILR